MANTQTTTKKTNHYFRILAALAVLATVASLLLTTATTRPAHAASNTFTVTRIDDRADANPGDGICSISTSGTFCTLRAAIQEANATTDKDTIGFSINAGGGLASIAPNSALPPITEPVIIDGYTQQGAQPNTKTVGNDASLKIELKGTNAPDAIGLEIQNASISVIRGLVINRFGEGIVLAGASSVGNRIEGNFIGTDPTGTVDSGAQTHGVLISQASKNVIGGSTPDERNVISSNGDAGVLIGFDSPANVIKGNYVGTDKSGTEDFGTQFDGIRITGRESGTTVGGTTAASRNVISGNNNFGLNIFEADGTKVLGNRIGTTADGKGALGNDFGVGNDGGSDLSIGDGTPAGSNTVAFNGGPALVIASDGVGNEVSGNSIFANDGLGIDLDGGVEDALGNSANDPLDADSGSNNLQNKPVLSSAKTVSGKTTIKGTLASTPAKTFTIEFFSNPSGEEGKKFIGQKSFTTDASGNATFGFSPATAVSVGQTVTATATSDSTHDTSEFSVPKKVASS